MIVGRRLDLSEPSFLISAFGRKRTVCFWQPERQSGPQASEAAAVGFAPQRAHT
jgi:hypothetical protein